MIRVEDLEVVYPNGTRGLAPTNLIFQSGVFTVFLGASGAGKSTLLRALNGLVTPTRGRVLIDESGHSPATAISELTGATPAWCSSSTN